MSPELPRLRKTGWRANPNNISNLSEQSFNVAKMLSSRLNAQNRNVNIFPNIRLYNKGKVSGFCDPFNGITVNGVTKECEGVPGGSQFSIYKFNMDDKKWVYKLSRSSHRNPEDYKGYYIQEYLNEHWTSLENLNQEVFEEQINKICDELMRVYRFFYKKGIKHNDFHLGNIMFNPNNGKMKIIDYDLMTFHNPGTEAFSLDAYKRWYQKPTTKTPDTVYLNSGEVNTTNKQKQKYEMIGKCLISRKNI